MTYLFFCAQDIGGQVFRLASALSKSGQKVAYICSGDKRGGPFNTNKSTIDGTTTTWDYSQNFQEHSSKTSVAGALRATLKGMNIRSAFATGQWAHIVKDIGIPYIYWAYGSDLDQTCFRQLPIAGQPPIKKIVSHLIFSATERRRIRKSVRHSECVLIAPYQRDTLERIAPGKRTVELCHYLDQSPLLETFRFKQWAKKQLLAETRLQRFIFSPTRHIWSGALRNETDNKGNDIILHAFQQFLARSEDVTTQLVLVKKGPDWSATVDLAHELRIEKRTVFVEEMTREQLTIYYAAAELCLGQFGTPVLTYAAVEPLAVATPSASYFHNNAPTIYSHIPPIFNTNSPNDLCAFISHMLTDNRARRSMSIQSWCWANRNCSHPVVSDELICLLRGI